MSAALTGRIDRLCEEAAGRFAGSPFEARVTALRQRLHGPLRIAIAGRAKAGKSTLLNGLVGERLAATDAGECTRIVAWFRHGAHYTVDAHLRGGDVRPLRFHREEEELRIELEDLAEDDIARLDVGWPSRRLERFTLIDTPGVDASDIEVERRTRTFLGLDAGAISQADAVVYLMRHVHRSDAAFLEAFHEGSPGNTSPVNAVGVLSRADEIGAGRLDALASAKVIAQRYAADAQLRPLVSTVVPVAGLLAETGATLREDEARALRDLAGEPEDVREGMLLSADRFCAPEASVLTAEIRRELLERLGLFGVRYAVSLLQQGRGHTATELASELISASGAEGLMGLLEQRFGGRARQLVARSALTELHSLASEAGTTHAAEGRWLEGEVEAVRASAHELAELDLLHLALTGEARLAPQEVAEIERLVSSAGAAERLGAEAGAPADQLRQRALEGVARWRERAAGPLTDRLTAHASEIAARSYEGLYVGLG